MPQPVRNALLLVFGVIAIVVPLGMLVRQRIDANRGVPFTQTSSPPPEYRNVVPPSDSAQLPSENSLVTSSPRIPEPSGSGEVAKDACETAGGHWNPCGSACRNAPPNTACIMMCVPQCECRSNAQCPSGTACSDQDVKGVGICK